MATKKTDAELYAQILAGIKVNGNREITPEIHKAIEDNMVASKLSLEDGGIVEAVIQYISELTLTDRKDIVYKGYVDDAVAAGGLPYTAEDVANKDTDGTLSANSDTKYPSQKATKTYVDNKSSTAENNAKSYADGLVVGLWDDRGNYNASGNVFPSSGGSGTAGAILKGDIWTISVAGTLGGNAVGIGDTVRALIDTPGSTSSNWAIAENNIGYVPENSANKDTDGTLAANSDTKYASQKATKTYADTKISTTLNSAKILVGNGSNVATAVDMSGDATISNAGAITLSNAAVIAKVLTAYAAGAGTVSATDTILQALQKLDGNDALKESIANFQKATEIYFTASGTDTYTATPSPAFGSYTTGMRVYLTFTNANTGASTINLNGLGAKSIKKSGSSALVAGDIAAGQTLILSYDGTNFQVIGGGASLTNNSVTYTIGYNGFQLALVQSMKLFTGN